ncbi:hypothetical protein K1719_026723 [Acacia pycnantha]|nr:hypothetical protein K1719_026723 [Acacia pycnantha]
MDMLSLIPESLFFTIVSLLPFKEAAITSIFSKRWLHAWRSTPNIDFNKSFFVNPDDDDDSPPETKRSQKLAFDNFINRFLENYQEPLIGKFSLKFSKPSEFSDTFQRCITFAFQRGVRQLELDFSELTWDKDDNDEESGGDDHHVPSFRLPSDVFVSCNEDGKMISNLILMFPAWIACRGHAYILDHHLSVWLEAAVFEASPSSSLLVLDSMGDFFIKAREDEI